MNKLNDIPQCQDADRETNGISVSRNLSWINAPLWANEDQFPHHVFIEFETSSTGEIKFCAGALISPDWILTTASCVTRGQNFKLRIGSILHYSGGSLETSFEVFVHPFFNASSHTLDAALIRLPTSISLLQHTVIKLPNSYQARNLNVTNRVAVTSGLGFDNTGGVSPVLRYGYVQLLHENDYLCRQVTGHDWNPQLPLLHCGRIFVRSRSSHGCQFDEGSPLILFEDGRWILLGLSVFGSDNQNCDESVHLYTNIFSLTSWITAISNIN